MLARADTAPIGRQYSRSVGRRVSVVEPHSEENRTPDPIASPEPRPGTLRRLRRLLVGSPRDLRDSRLFHRLSLIPFLAWVGLGADGLSSSAYGPEEAFKALGEHAYLAVALAAAHGRNRVAHLRRIPPYHRRVSQRGRWLRGGKQPAGAQCRCGLRSRPAGGLRSHHHHLALPPREMRSSASCR